MIKLKISPSIALPAEAITQTIGILAKRGAGKSYTASVLAEEFVTAKLPFCVLDPTGAWWGLRVMADGKPGLSVVIIGGKHGDIPLEPTAGKLIADLIVDNPGFYVLDLSMFDSNASQDRFATDFAERLYRRKQQSREPLHLFVDEADSFAPQRPYRGQERMLGAFEALSRRGRIYGIGVTLISQRAAVINKNVLSQIEVLIALQTTAPHDRDAIEAWAEGHGTKKQVEELMNTLASLDLGEAWIWSPSWLELFKRVQIRERLTFNSSATPKVGEIRREPKALAAVDIEKLRKLMAETIERVKIDDPAALRKQIAELKKHQCPVVNQNPTRIERIEVPTVGKRTLEGLKKSEASMRRILAAVKDANMKTTEHTVIIEKHIAKFAAILDVLPKKNNTDFRPGGIVEYPNPAKVIRPPTPTGATVQYAEPLNEGEITGPEQRVLNALAWCESIGNMNPPNELVAFLSGYSHFRSTGYTNPRGYLKAKGLVEYASSSISLTRAGRTLAVVPATPLTQEELHRAVLDRLDGPERRLLKPLLEKYPDAISNADLCAMAGYMHERSTGYTNPRGRLKSFGLVECTKGFVAARSILFFP